MRRGLKWLQRVVWPVVGGSQLLALLDRVIEVPGRLEDMTTWIGWLGAEQDAILGYVALVLVIVLCALLATVELWWWKVVLRSPKEEDVAEFRELSRLVRECRTSFDQWMSQPEDIADWRLEQQQTLLLELKLLGRRLEMLKVWTPSLEIDQFDESAWHAYLARIANFVSSGELATARRRGRKLAAALPDIEGVSNPDFRRRSSPYG